MTPTSAYFFELSGPIRGSVSVIGPELELNSGYWTLSSLMFTLETLSGNLTWTPFCLS